jgi:hypothetical protein
MAQGGTIKLQCPCGQTLQLPDTLVGKQVRCKRCNKVLTVRQSTVDARDALSESQRGRLAARDSGRMQQLDKALTVQGSRPCPGCGALYAPAVVVCVGCGLNVDSGAMLYASLDDTSGSPAAKAAEQGPPPSLWSRLLGKLGLGSRR